MTIRSLFVLLGALALFPAGAHAQTPPRNPSNPSADTSRNARAQQNRLTPQQQEIIRRIRESGLSREQTRERLRQAGYDPNLADRYFEELNRPDSTAASNRFSRFAQPLPPPTGSLVAALTRIGILTARDSLPSDSVLSRDPRDPREAREARPRADRPRSTEPQVFGRELFAATVQFEPVATGPIDPDYRLGPGDELTLIVTGDVELAYTLQITREGYVVVPDVGQVLVNGLTMDQLKGRLNERLGRVYSGIQVGTAQFDVSVGKLRSKLVYVVGEVEVPGAYQLSGSATAFNALYRAGGPAVNGSFREIEVRRGNRVIQVVDLYSYLLAGDKGSDVRLEQGDVAFVPVVGTQVTIMGSVRRPAIYEMKPGEGLRDLLRFAGGVEAQAAVERVQIDRILPAGQRQPGRERVLVDVSLSEIVRGRPVALADGDRVRVSAISEARRNRVAATGDVQRPGEYEFHSGMTVKELIDAAQGLLTTAYTPTAHVVRVSPRDSSTTLIRVTLDDPAAPDYAGRVQLADLDELFVFGRAKLANPRMVEIFGSVKNPGTYSFSEGMAAEDLVLLAGGFTDGAEQNQAEVARRIMQPGLADTVATVYQVPFKTRFPLMDGDQVFIRRTPGFERLSTVEVTGEILYPGVYTVNSRSERVTDVLRRAGGPTREAYVRGFRLFRDGKPVGVDLPKELARPGSRDDIFIMPGDRMEVPRLDPTVLVTGAVGFESRVRYEKGLSVSDYLSRAGGVREDGNAGRVSVRYPNGELRSARRRFGVRTSPRVEPGSTITVPVKSEQSGFDYDKVVGRTLAALSSLATIILTIRAVR